MNIDEFKQKVCWGIYNDTTPFSHFWETILGLPKIDLNVLTVRQVYGVGFFLTIFEWDGKLLKKEGNFLVKERDSMFENEKEKSAILLSQFKAMRTYAVNTEHFMVVSADGGIVLTQDLEALEGSSWEESWRFPKRLRHPEARREHAKIFKEFYPWSRPKGECLCGIPEDPKYKDPDYFDLPFRTYWEKNLGLNPVNLNTLTYSQIMGIGYLIQFDLKDGRIDKCYDVAKKKDVEYIQRTRKGDYFAIICNYAPGYYYGLTNDFLFFDEDIPAIEKSYKPDPIVYSQEITDEIEKLFG